MEIAKKTKTNNLVDLNICATDNQCLPLCSGMATDLRALLAIKVWMLSPSGDGKRRIRKGGRARSFRVKPAAAESPTW